MGLIYCANCEGKASDQIESCPHCGHPLNGVTQNAAGGTQTVEQTSKKWKAVQLISACGVIVGVMMCVGSDEAGTVAVGKGLLASSIAGVVIGRVCAWWYHG